MSKATRVCVWCRKSEAEIGKPLLQCTSCNDYLYCDRRCQAADLNEGVHKYYCKKYVSFKRRVDAMNGTGPGFVVAWDEWFDGAVFLLSAMAVARLGSVENALQMAVGLDLSVENRKGSLFFRISGVWTEHVGDSSSRGADNSEEASQSVCQALPGVGAQINGERAKFDTAKTVTVFFVTRCREVVKVFPVGVHRNAFTFGLPNVLVAQEIVDMINQAPPVTTVSKSTMRLANNYMSTREAR